MNQRTRNLILFSVVVLVVVLFGMVMFHQLKHGDFPAHINWAREYSENGYLYKIPHTLFARLLTVVRALLPANLLVWISPMAKQVYDLKSYEISTLIVMTLSYLFTAGILLRRLIKEWEIKEKSVLYFAGLAVLIIMIVAPVFVFTFPDRMFLGYVMGNRYDSPTYILLKPFALLFFLNLVDNLMAKWSWKQGMLIVVIIVCASLAKPSLTVTLIPALGILLLFKLKQWEKVNWWYVIIPVGITTLLVLLSQFIINFSGDRGDRVILAPFESILVHVPNIPMVFLLILMSLLFPMAVTFLNWKEVKGELGFQLGWMNMIVALITGLLLAEEINLVVNNFWNGPMIGAFVLFFVTVSWWGRDVVKTRRQKLKLTKKQIVTSGLLALHFICGIVYYVATMLNAKVLVV